MTLTFLLTFTAKPHYPMSLCCDGEYLYLLTESALIKVGTGLGGTANGRIYLVNGTFVPPSKGTLIFAQVTILSLLCFAFLAYISISLGPSLFIIPRQDSSYCSSHRPRQSCSSRTSENVTVSKPFARIFFRWKLHGSDL